LDTLREVETLEAEALADHIPEIMAVLETSAREDTNITESFLLMARHLKEQYSSPQTFEQSQDTTRFNLSSKSVSGKYGCC
jgi:Ras-related protein Rab-43